MRIATLICLTLAALSPSMASAVEEPPRLSRNPFSRPPSQVDREERTFVQSDDGSGPALALHATMVGRKFSLANVAGQILKPGDEVQGYRLIAIYEEYAVFKRDNKITTVYVKPKLAEDDE